MAADKSNDAQENLASGRKGAEGIDADATELASIIRIAVLKLVRHIREAPTYHALPASLRSVLVRINEHGPLSLKQLAQLEFIQPSAATRAIAQLEKNGLAQKTPHPIDGRGRIVEITPAGIQTIEEFRQARDEKILEWLATLKPTERRLLARSVVIFDYLGNTE